MSAGSMPDTPIRGRIRPNRAHEFAQVAAELGDVRSMRQFDFGQYSVHGVESHGKVLLIRRDSGIPDQTYDLVFWPTYSSISSL
jgi:hypothetical protein